MNLLNRIIRINIQRPITSKLTQLIRNQLENFSFYQAKVLAVQIDCQGGSVVQAKQIQYLLQKFAQKQKLPILCFAGAQVYNSANIILSCADKIIAANNSEIGDYTFSGQLWNISELIKRENLEVINLSHGKYKDRLNPFQPYKETDKEWLNNSMKNNEIELKKQITLNLSKKFINLHEQTDCLNEAFQSSILTGYQAQKLKIVDEIGTIDEYLQSNYKNMKTIEFFKPQAYNIQQEIIEKLIS
ncbi:unnamed protein product (macronuclear) [Paramecium tetraurelia]|uniref:Peptidase S49 domain-containing protein n=1 Tax=Paramecium tetraurelia TaxID=5888 RepID=A0CBQ3_PARTE|nr:uncharacterized protein GSPATT00037003001 [Paramecium tetraurelia]CAK68220.1 unnamed protein product [Paramecium tetraurelia]|eukprot:XP_001435617.1 hypothetical protein (macronuclear) [Paramecium tetraurelia strain d4-2]